MANSVEPDQMLHSGSTLFAQTCVPIFRVIMAVPFDYLLVSYKHLGEALLMSTKSYVFVSHLDLHCLHRICLGLPG